MDSNTFILPKSEHDSGAFFRDQYVTIQVEEIITRTAKIEIIPNIMEHQREILRDVIENLLKRIDFLGYELNYKSELLSEDEFDAVARLMLKTDDLNITSVIEKITTIYPFIKNKERIGSNLFSTMFCCDIDRIQSALSEILRQNYQGKLADGGSYE